MKESRMKNSIFNAASSLIILLSKHLLGFITRTVFIYVLGEVYLGVNGLLTNVLQMLSLADLGISAAISFSLYKPLSENNIKEISSLMTFFRKIYKVIGITITGLGIILYFFLPFLIKEYNSIPQLNIIYFLYLINTVSIYFISYKDILITADQKAYKLTKINFIFSVGVNAAQIITLLLFRHFIAYLTAQFFVQILQRFFINRYIGKKYFDITFNSADKINDSVLNEIKKNIKALMVHKFGDFAVNGTDNLIISSMINVVTVGFFSNYTMITQLAHSLISNLFSNITPSFGNLLVDNDKKKSLDVFHKMDFSCFLLYGLFGVVFFSAANRFIMIWIGEKYILSSITVYLMSFSFFLTGLRIASFTVKSAAGIFQQDQWSPFVQSIINLCTSIILAKIIGLNGVIIGTIVSSLIPNFTRIYYIYRDVFDKKWTEHLFGYFIPYILFFIITSVLSYWICSFITISGFLGLIVCVLLSVLVYIVIFILLFFKFDEYKYLLDILKKMIAKITKRSDIK